MINIIIYSKNRACQLELLLRSFNHCFADFKSSNISVIYKYTDDNYKLGYDIVKNKYNISFIQESNNIKSDTLKLILPANQYTMFLVDDIFFKDKFSLYDYEFMLFNNNIDILSLSLRLHPNINFCYPTNKPTPQPTMIQNIWNWKGSLGDFGYPMSLDGNIYRTPTIYNMIEKINFNSPNELEGVLNNLQIDANLMMCYEISKLINNPCNIVQNVIPNRFNKTNCISTEYFNLMFLDSYIIDLNPLLNIKTNSCHSELPYTFIKNTNY